MDWNLDNYRTLIERHLTVQQIADLREVMLKVTAQHRDDDPMLLIVAIVMLNGAAFTNSVERFVSAAQSAGAIDAKRVAQEIVFQASLGLKHDRLLLDEVTSHARAVEVNLEQKVEDCIRQFEHRCAAIVARQQHETQQRYLSTIAKTVAITVALTLVTIGASIAMLR